MQCVGRVYYNFLQIFKIFLFLFWLGKLELIRWFGIKIYVINMCKIGIYIIDNYIFSVSNRIE